MEMENKHASSSDSKQSYPSKVCDVNRGLIYKRGQFLGMGSFGKCFLMKEENTGRPYAAKVLEKKILKNPFHSNFLLEELAIHRLLRHKNIVTFYQTFEDEKFIYIILELCNNGTLMDLQKRRQCLTLMEAKYYLQHIINGVSYLHNKMHIVHGDLKLSNIFISNNMIVKIGDFGLATAISYEGDKIQKQCGTPNYMAPEIVQRKGHSYAGDVWAIGCILYGLLVGRLPFQCCKSNLMYDKIKKCDYSIYEPGLRKQVSMFIKKILKKNPDDRPSITDLKNDEFMSGFIPLSLPDYTLWEPPQPRDLLPRPVRSTRSNMLHSKNTNTTKSSILNRRKRMKPYISRMHFARQIAVV